MRFKAINRFVLAMTKIFQPVTLEEIMLFELAEARKKHLAEENNREYSAAMARFYINKIARLELRLGFCERKTQDDVFPANPSLGQTYVFNGLLYCWTGERWEGGYPVSGEVREQDV